MIKKNVIGHGDDSSARLCVPLLVAREQFLQTFRQKEEN